MLDEVVDGDQFNVGTSAGLAYSFLIAFYILDALCPQACKNMNAQICIRYCIRFWPSAGLSARVMSCEAA